MPLPMRVSIAGCRLGNPLRSQISRPKVVENINSSLRRNLTTEAGPRASSSSSQSRLIAAGNVVLGTLLIGAGAGTVYFTYLRFKNSGFGMGVAANTIMDDGLHPAAYPWPNNHPFATFDHAR